VTQREIGRIFTAPGQVQEPFNLADGLGLFPLGRYYLKLQTERCDQVGVAGGPLQFQVEGPPGKFGPLRRCPALGGHQRADQAHEELPLQLGALRALRQPLHEGQAPPQQLDRLSVGRKLHGPVSRLEQRASRLVEPAGRLPVPRQPSRCGRVLRASRGPHLPLQPQRLQRLGDGAVQVGARHPVQVIIDISLEQAVGKAVAG
jgi:hypothetical protein